MNQPRISIKKTLQFAFNTTFKKAPLLYGALFASLALFMLYMLTGISLVMIVVITTLFPSPEATAHISPFIFCNPFSLVGFIFYLVVLTGYLLFIFLGIGYTNIAFDLHDTGQSSIKRLFSGKSILFRSAFLYLLYFWGKIISSALFFIPGLLFDSNFMLASYFMVDKKYGIHESFKKSKRAARGSRLRILAVMYIIYGIIALSALPAKLIPALQVLVSIALFLLVPVRILSAVYMCRQLQATDAGRGALGAPEAPIPNLVP